MAANAKARTQDALVLLTDAGVHTLADSVRGLGIVIVRHEPLIKDLIKSNRENAIASRELAAELRKARRHNGKSGKNGNGTR